MPVANIAKKILLNEFVLFLPVGVLFYVSCINAPVFIAFYPVVFSVYIFFYNKDKLRDLDQESSPNFLKFLTKIDLRYISKLFLMFTLPILLLANTILYNYDKYDVINSIISDSAAFIDFSREFLPFNELILVHISQSYSYEYSRLVTFIFSYVFFISMFLTLCLIFVSYTCIRRSWFLRSGSFYNEQHKNKVMLLGVFIFWPVFVSILYAGTNVFDFGQVNPSDFIESLTAEQLNQSVNLSAIVRGFSIDELYKKIMFLAFVPLILPLTLGIKMGASQKWRKIMKSE